MSLHKILLKVHLYLGMIAGVLLLVIAGTGCILAFDRDIDRLLNPGSWNVTPGPSRVPFAQMIDRLSKTTPKTRVSNFILPPGNDMAYIATTNRGVQVFVDPYTGDIKGTRAVRDGFVSTVRQMHARLLLGKPGEQVVGYSALTTVVLSITGLILWWPRKLLKFRRDSSWRRINFDLHHAIGFFSSLLVLLLALTGSVITFSETAIPWIFKVTGDPPAPNALPMYTIPAGSKPISVERLVEVANAVLPDARTTIVPIPRANDEAYVEVTKKAPGDEGYGQSLVLVNQWTGEVVRAEDSRTAAAGTRALALNRSIHFGEVFGYPSRIIMALASLCLLLQAVSGFVIWLARQKRKPKVVRPRVQEQTA